jgi:CBS-domain-containing membrane protein
VGFDFYRFTQAPSIAPLSALIAVIGGEKIHNLGFMYALFPVGGGMLIKLIIALLVNNIPKNRRYPEFWL